MIPQTHRVSDPRADECRDILDRVRIEAHGAASLLECPTEAAVLRRSVRLLRMGYPLVAVDEALSRWEELRSA